jgi:beta-phosphoglucomutase
MDALLLDYNGVIVDDEPLHCVAFRDVLAEAGIVIEEPEYWSDYVGIDDRAAFREAFRRAGRAVEPAGVGRLVARKASRYAALAERQFELVPGVARFVRQAACAGPVAVVSGALRAEITAGLARGELADAVAIVVAQEDVAVSKPDPAAYRLALSRLAIAHPRERWRVCVVEDSLPGLAAARALGAGCVMLTTAHAKEALAGADLVWDSFEEHTPADLGPYWRAVEAPRG